MKVAAFDLDETLLEGDSDLLFIPFAGARGLVDPGPITGFMDDYHAGRLDLAAFYAFTLTPFRERSAAELTELLDDFHATCIAPRLRPTVVAELHALQTAGWLAVLVTATNSILAARTARALGVDGLVATDPERRAGRYTGRVTGEPAFRDGKLARLEAWVARRGASLEDLEGLAAFSDSHNDLPLLERTAELGGRAVTVTPDPVLRERARGAGWELLELPAGP